MSKDGEEHTDVVEIDAIGAEEWERDQHTPQAIESNLAALVKQSASSNSGPVRTKQLDDGWEDANANSEAAKPRTTTNTLRRTGAAPAVPLSRKTQAMGTPIKRPAVAVVAKPATAATTPTKSKAADAKPTPAVAPAAAEAPVTNGWVKKARATSEPSADPTFAPFSPPFASQAKRPPTPQPMAALAPQVAEPKRNPTPQPMAALPKPSLAVEPKRNPTPQPMAAQAPQPIAEPKRSPTPQPMAALPKRNPTPQPMVALAVEPAKRPPTPQPMAVLKARAPTPPPMPALSRTPTPQPMPSMASEPTKVLPPSAASELAAVADAAQDWSDPTQTGVRMPPETELPATPTKARAPTAPTVVAKHLHSPVWSARTEPAAREPDMLPPPPEAGFEDWENPNANTTLGNRVQAPSTDVAADFLREDSVIIDLNAVARESGVPKRPQTYPIIQTSEQSTTTSGVFSMPTAAAPKAVEVSLGAAHVATPAPTLPALSLSPFQRQSLAWHTPVPQTLPGQATAAPPVPSFPSAVGLVDDLAVPSQIKVDLTEPALARRTRRRSVLLVAGGSLGLLLVLIVAFSGGSHSPKAEPPTAVAKPTTSSTTSATTTSTTTPSHAAAAAPVSVAATDTVPDKLEAPARPTKKPVVAKRRNFRAKKPVVLDYDKKQDPTPSQDEALASARVAYATGNQHLFAGQADAAVASYNQALADYPSYVAGYRGLGLAYAQQGNRSAALTAFKTYVSLAPNAKDVALIEKRISSLSIGAH